MLTSSALVTLAGAGKLKLDAPIGNYVKGLNPRLAQVTAHQLLSQSAGLRDFAATVTSNDDAALGNQARSWKSDKLLSFINKQGRPARALNLVLKLLRRRRRAFEQRAGAWRPPCS